MKRALVVLSVIVGLIAVVAVVGYLLPEEHTATAQRSFDAAPDEVWRLITDVDHLPEWRPNLKKVERVSSTGEPLSWLETWARGDEMPFLETERVEGRKLVVAIASDDLPFGGSWTYELEPTATGTTVTVTENGEVRDPFFRFVSRLFMDPTTTMNVYLDDLGNALDSRSQQL